MKINYNLNNQRYRYWKIRLHILELFDIFHSNHKNVSTMNCKHYWKKGKTIKPQTIYKIRKMIKGNFKMGENNKRLSDRQIKDWSEISININHSIWK